MVKLNIDTPAGFLDSEYRDGWLVEEKMKQVWAVELDLLNEFQRVCKKHNIPYVASGGTMLGAARHKGFIPWDDDVDLMMLRKDYDRLIEVSKEFKEPYFLQSYSNDKGFFRCFLRLRNSETTAIQNTELSCKFGYNQGIFIDIFPLDNIVQDKQLFAKQSLRARKYLRKALLFSSIESRYYKDSAFVKRCARKVGRTFFSRFVNDLEYLQLYEKECCRYNAAETEKVGLLSFQFDNRVHDIGTEDLRDTIETDFEFLKIPIPRNYDSLLEWKYGQWRVAQRAASYHGEIFFDSDRSYKYYIEKQ